MIDLRTQRGDERDRLRAENEQADIERAREELEGQRMRE
jgi:hypothetical protein